MKTAVIKILKGRNRTENRRFMALRSHYGFESFFCEPGIDGAHEKGGVEGDIGRFRRNHLTPVPVFDTLAGLNAHITAADLADDARFVTGRGPGAGDRVAGLWVFEQGGLWPLPVEVFDATTRLDARVDTKARVCVRQCFYSVPERFAGQRVGVALGADTVTITDPKTMKMVAVHKRALHRRCEVLLLHRTHTASHVLIGITAALSVASIDPAVVAIETRRAIEHQQPAPPLASPVLERLPATWPATTGSSPKATPNDPNPHTHHSSQREHGRVRRMPPTQPHRPRPRTRRPVRHRHQTPPHLPGVPHRSITCRA